MKGYLCRLQSFFVEAKRIMSYYAVARGRNPGVYRSWDECKAQVDKFSGAAFKKFSSISEANIFITERGGLSVSNLRSPRENKKCLGVCIKSTQNLGIKSRISDYCSKKRHKSDDFDASDGCETSKAKSFKTEGPKEGLTIDRHGRVDIFTDGACSSNGQRNAKAGLGVYFGDDHPLNVSKAVRGRPTNNNAEIQAVTEAAIIARKNGMTKIRINTDSQFLINCITKWMDGWERRGWKTASNQPVINKTELIEMKRALEPLDVEFNHIRGHTGIHGNEMADRLARRGAEES